MLILRLPSVGGVGSRASGTIRCFASTSRTCYAKPTHTVKQRPIDKLLIANRGEIACRVMRTARRMGVRTVAVYSEVDASAMHVAMADEAYCIGAAAAAESYLRQDRIIDTALQCGAQAIHPGYGFLSENAAFADACAEANVIFVGPPSQAIRDMGLKSRSKQIMEKAGVPVVLGYHGDEQSDDRLRTEAARIGYPVMLKAVYGGGGKGMRIAPTAADFQEQLDSARREAKKSFGNDEMIVEVYVDRPRHVEVQVFGDQHGNYVYLYERDCSVQRRHQKIIEEAPAPGISADARRTLGEAAVRAAQAVGYYGAGTVEFIMDAKERFYFMEMNTRLQVEHPVTEMITGTDLVEWQLLVAQGQPLPITDQSRIQLNGCAFECRVYAEDEHFMPQAGLLQHLRFPPASSSVRVETGVAQGDEVSVHYDPMIAKLVVHAGDRLAALRLMRNVLGGTHIVGLHTNIEFMRRILAHKDFVDAQVYTGFIPDRIDELVPKQQAKIPTHVLCAVASAHSLQAARETMATSPHYTHNDPFSVLNNYRVNLSHTEHVHLLDKDRPLNLQLTHTADGLRRVRTQCGQVDVRCGVHVRDVPDAESMILEVSAHAQYTLLNATAQVFLPDAQGARHTVTSVQTEDQLAIFDADRSYVFTLVPPKWLAKARAGSDAAHAGAVAPMPGVIEKVLVEAGATITANQPLVVMVAMKMEYIIRAARDGRVARVCCAPGDNVKKHAQLVVMEDDNERIKAAA